MGATGLMKKKAFNRQRPPVRRPLWEELLAQERLIIDDFAKERLALRDLRERTEKMLGGAAAPPPLPAAPPRLPEEPPASPAPIPPPRVPAPAPVTEPAAALRFRLDSAMFAHWRVAAMVIVALLLALVMLQWRPWSDPLRGVFPLPYSGAAGLCADPKTGLLYTTDPARQLLFPISPDNGQLKTPQRFPAPGLKGLACGSDGHFWSSDGEALYRHNPANQNTVGKKYSIPGLRPGALYWDGRTLWAADPGRSTVDRFLPGEGFSSVGSFRVDGKLPAGIASARELLWVLDAVDMKVHRYPVSGGAAADSLALEPLLPRGSRPSGLALAGEEMWLMTDNPAELRCFTIDGLRFRKAR